MNLSKFLVLKKSHDLELHSPTLWTGIPCLLISLCNPSLLWDEARKDGYTHKLHNFISFKQPLPVHCLMLATLVSSISSPGGVHRLSASPQSLFNSPASLQKQSDFGSACNSKLDSTTGVLRALQLFQSTPYPLPLQLKSYFACLRASQHRAKLCKELPDIRPHFHLANTLHPGPLGVSKQLQVCPETHITLNVLMLSFVCQRRAHSFNLALFPRHFSQPFLATANLITLSHLQIFI